MYRQRLQSMAYACECNSSHQGGSILWKGQTARKGQQACLNTDVACQPYLLHLVSTAASLSDPGTRTVEAHNCRAAQQLERSRLQLGMLRQCKPLTLCFEVLSHLSLSNSEDSNTSSVSVIRSPAATIFLRRLRSLTCFRRRGLFAVVGCQGLQEYVCTSV